MIRLLSIRTGHLSWTRNPAGTRRQTCGRSCGLLRGNVGSTPTHPRTWPRHFKAALLGVHIRNDNRERTPPLVRLKALCGPGDQGEPVIRILMPEQD